MYIYILYIYIYVQKAALSCTALLSPPQKGSPQVTTEPPTRRAAKAAQVDSIRSTDFSSAWVVLRRSRYGSISVYALASLSRPLSLSLSLSPTPRAYLDGLAVPSSRCISPGDDGSITEDDSKGIRCGLRCDIPECEALIRRPQNPRSSKCGSR